MDVAPSIPAVEVVRSTQLPPAKDMSHHLNRITKNRKANALKEMYKYAAMEGMVSMAGGIPSPAIFPFESLSAEILPPNRLPLDPPRTPRKPKKSLMEWLFGGNITFTIPKYAENPKDPLAIQLATSLQYSQATGPPAFPKFLRQYVETVLKPGFADWDVLLDDGATDGFGKVCHMLLELGDTVLVEEWTYPGAINTYAPFETNVVALQMDGEGVLPAHMESVLANWDESQGRRPRLFYTVPTGQNPTGATMMAKRKKEIYDICSKYDVVIVEDEPYYTLFVGDYIPKGSKATPLVQHQIDAEKKDGEEGNEAFIKALPPSYLRFDTDGRVIRLDTFSKTSCPGSRLGWITSSPLFIERLTRISEASTQAPSGFSTAMTITLLNTWGWEGYVRWLRGLKAMYRMRRDWMCDALADKFHLEFDSDSLNALVCDIPGVGRGVTAYARDAASEHWDEKRGVAVSAHGRPLLSFIPPTAGMFIWLAVHVNNHPDFPRLAGEHGDEDATHQLMQKLWRKLAEHMVLFAPGFNFDAHGGPHRVGGAGVGFFRLSFSITPYEDIYQAMDTFAAVLTKFFK